MAIDLNILRIDSRRDDIRGAMAELRRRLSPRGDVVTPEGRQRTIEVFGEPLAPAEVVQRICRDVQEKGLAAVLDYSRRIDKAELTAETLRVPHEELASAHARADRDFLEAVRRIRKQIATFQEALLLRDVRLSRPHGYLAERYRPLDRVGICVPGGSSGVSVHRADDRRARPGGRRPRVGRGRAAHQVRKLQPRPAGHLSRVGDHRGLPAGRRPGRGGIGLRRGGNPPRGQDRRAREPVRRVGEEARLRRGGYRLDRRAERGGGDRGPLDPGRIHRLRPDRPGGTCPGGEHPDRLGRGGLGRRGGRVGAAVASVWSAASWRGRAWRSSER